MQEDVSIYNQPPSSWYSIARRHLESARLYFSEFQDQDDISKHMWCYMAVECSILGFRAESGLVAEVLGDAGDLKELLGEAAANLGCAPDDLPLPSCVLENIDFIRTWRYVNEPPSVTVAEYGCEPLLDAGLCREIVDDLDQWLSIMLSRT